MFIDSHCHIDFEDLANQEEALFERMASAKVTHAVCIGVNLENFPRILKMADSHQNLFATVGVHPENTEGEEPDVACLAALAKHPKVIAIGETGLDYYWHKDQPEWQRERFRVHIRAAREAGLPLVIHTRDSAQDVLRILTEERADTVGGVMHCFTENLAVAEAAMALGFHISFSGILTFKNAAQIKEVAASIPLERILIETDSPYLAPVPYRGKLNEPSYVPRVAAEIARLRGIGIEAVANASSTNFWRCFPRAAEAQGAA
ncbi:MAG: DNAase [Candidatus Dactylopiibacterium carminicum]|uniref:DNAase n=1 Tax=Candidatus Dactylopiibacterium carminicum TaxID=857335 RepID=A0A272ENY7_9RHOO|nr:TatD family hydrolase [Candidatus Dactylopiibacterium carminicum]KAF7598160.1 TatD family deoxyribonuclease [Candidatus Dactylopiibacterium carminicum]PAS91835.1 MAG: DNAase [Candidatus Dactylopiibacterium carminicum]PAS94529.1 MAG: DNAase [Candidatus Dactylopiibacterium carminicum]PAS96810.1 MAG: DNAase [Candidatus Dactylopiibacterium carminicum]